MPAHSVRNVVLPEQEKLSNFFRAVFLKIMEGGLAVRHYEYTRDPWSDAYAGLFVSQPFWFPIP